MRSGHGKKYLISGLILLLVIGCLWIIYTPNMKYGQNAGSEETHATSPVSPQSTPVAQASESGAQSVSNAGVGNVQAVNKVQAAGNVQGVADQTRAAQLGAAQPGTAQPGAAQRAITQTTIQNAVNPKVQIPTGGIAKSGTEARTARMGGITPATSLPNLANLVGSATSTGASASAGAKTEEGCFTVSFSPKKQAAGRDFASQKNLLTLLDSTSAGQVSINPKSVCVLVNGSAVKHSFVPGSSNQVLIGAVAGIDTKVTARFCVGKATCSEKCEVKKDEFMNALGMDDSTADSGEAPTVGWDGSKQAAKEDVELETEVAALNEEQGGSKGGIFSAWVAETHTLTCARRAL